MRVLMLSTDKQIFQKGSDVRSRIINYGELFDELHVVVFSPRVFKDEALGEHTRLYPTNSLFKFLYIWDAYGVCERILKKMENISSVVVSAQDAPTALVALLLKLQFSFSFQLQIHTDFASPYFRRESLKNYLYYLGYRLGIRYADCVRVVSNRIKNSLAELGIRNDDLRTNILPIYVDVEKIKTTPIVVDLRKKYPQFDFIILMASRLAREKNIPLALRVVNKFIKKYPKTGLIIVGEGPKQRELELEIEEHKLENNTVIESWMDYNKLISYYKTTDLFLLTSEYEGYGRTLVEAAASGCPIVTTEVGLVGELFIKDKHALVCSPHDDRCIEKSLEKMIQSKALRAALAVESRVAIQSLGTREDYLEAYKNSFSQCISDNHIK